MARFADLDVPRKSRVQWETREITMPRDTTRQEAKALLTEYAEYGHWELARLRLYRDGRRWALLRRRKMRIDPDWE
jgi:hypothetical protein